MAFDRNQSLIPVLMTRDMWDYTILGLKDCADRIQQHTNEQFRSLHPDDLVGNHTMVLENVEVYETIERQLGIHPLPTCSLADLEDLARVGSTVIIDGAIWKVVEAI